MDWNYADTSLPLAVNYQSVPKSRNPLISSDSASRNDGALSDYYRQLELLELQNKKRSLMRLNSEEADISDQVEIVPNPTPPPLKPSTPSSPRNEPQPDFNMMEMMLLEQGNKKRLLEFTRHDKRSQLPKAAESQQDEFKKAHPDSQIEIAPHPASTNPGLQDYQLRLDQHNQMID